MEPRAKVWIAALRRSHDELAADIDAMNPDDLRRPSGASRWDVAGVLSHLGSGAEIGLAVWEANRAGAEPPPTEANQAVWDRWNAMGAEERAKEFVWRDEALVAAFEAVDGADHETLQVKLPFLPAPVDLATAVGFRLSEHALHSWDVRVAFTPDAVVPTYASELLVDRVGMMAGWIGRADAWTGRPTSIEIRTTDPDRNFWLALGDGVSLATDRVAADGHLRLPAEALVRLSAGRLAPDHTPAGVEIDGPASLDDLRAVFPGY